jgi:integrase/recombinase XerC
MTTAPTSAAASQQAAVDAALLVLKSMGLSLDDLLSAGSSNRQPVPTFAEYVPVVAATLTGSTLRAYSSYGKRTVEQWGGRRLDEPTPSEVKQLVAYVKANALQRRNSRGGGHAAENLISALRCLYNHAADDGLIAEKDNPARKVAKPRRLPSTRRALDGAQLAEINRVVTTTGNDPELDTLIVRLHTETACRHGGALALRPRDLNREQCLILLREKGETFRWQPVSPTLMAALAKHAEDRNAPSDEGLSFDSLAQQGEEHELGRQVALVALVAGPDLGRDTEAYLASSPECFPALPVCSSRRWGDLLRWSACNSTVGSPSGRRVTTVPGVR